MLELHRNHNLQPYFFLELNELFLWKTVEEAEQVDKNRIKEELAEMNNIELGFVIAGLSEIQKQQLTEMGVEI